MSPLTSNPETAQSLSVSRMTVENHFGRIYTKLEIKSRAQLADALAGSRPGAERP